VGIVDILHYNREVGLTMREYAKDFLFPLPATLHPIPPLVFRMAFRAHG
jgi:hypothetical protein